MANVNNYPLAPNGVFLTVQGEGALLGLPMIFVRLAGCSIGCPECDTDYRVFERLSAGQIARRCCELLDGAGAVRWSWITGGESTDHDLRELIGQLKEAGFSVALATAGHTPVQEECLEACDWVSVSPHSVADWKQMNGSEIKFVPGLNGLELQDLDHLLGERSLSFDHRFVQPCDGLPQTVKQCLDFVTRHQGWRMSVQAHKQWGLA